MYQRKVDEDMLNVVKSVLADVSSISPSTEQRLRAYVDVDMNWTELSWASSYKS